MCRLMRLDQIKIVTLKSPRLKLKKNILLQYMTMIVQPIRS